VAIGAQKPPKRCIGPQKQAAEAGSGGALKKKLLGDIGFFFKVSVLAAPLQRNTLFPKVTKTQLPIATRPKGVPGHVRLHRLAPRRLRECELKWDEVRPSEAPSPATSYPTSAGGMYIFFIFNLVIYLDPHYMDSHRSVRTYGEQ